MRAKINSLLVFFLLHFDIDMKYSYMENNFNGKLKKLSKETCNGMQCNAMRHVKKETTHTLFTCRQTIFV